MKIKRSILRITAIIITIIMCLSVLQTEGLGYVVSEASAKDPIVIVLDPGHGGNDAGACNAEFGTNEKNSNWEIALACKAYLEKYENVVVILTRSKRDEYSSLNSRVQVAINNDADLFVSLHNNSTASTTTSTGGCEVYISVVEPFASNTKQLAKDICSNLSSLGLRNRGVKVRKSTYMPDDDYYTVIAKSIMNGIPSLIVEHAFVNNADDAKKLNNPSMLKAMGEADGRAIAKYFNLKLKGSAATGVPTLETTAFMETYGWLATSPNSMAAGFVTYRNNDHRDKELQAFKIDLNNEGIPGDIVYQAYSTKTGWQPQVTSGNVAGSTTDDRLLEAIKVNLTGEMASKYDVYYRVLTGQTGWLGWAKNGAPAGKVGFGSEIKAIQVRLIVKGGNAPTSNIGAYLEASKAPESAKVAYLTHIQSYGWEVAEAYDGLTSGTFGQSKRLEGIVIRNNTSVPGSIEYQVHCQSYGWMDWVSDGEMAGTNGEAKRLEAIRIKLSGELADKYDVYYRVHAQSYGWLDWAKNGQAAGTSGFGKRLEGIEIVLVDKNGAAPGKTERPYVSKLVTYQTHVQTYGWQSNVCDGATSGTEGKSKRLEGIKITNTTDISGSVKYKVHCQTYGWMDWVADGALAGTTGEKKRLEGICIELTGELSEKYDVYYRVHCQTYGWLDWAKNGEQSGSEGLAKRLEAIQIVFVPKGGAAPGKTERPYINGNATSNNESGDSANTEATGNTENTDNTNNNGNSETSPENTNDANESETSTDKTEQTNTITTNNLDKMNTVSPVENVETESSEENIVNSEDETELITNE